MRDFEGGLAVITGGASGIGRALADAFAAVGMRVLLADREVAALEVAVAELRAAGADARGRVVDVASAQAVEELAIAAGDVDVLCANAGVMQPLGPSWERPLVDYEWVFGVNTWGIVHCIRSFVPRMLERGQPAHIVITASMSGLSVVPGNAPYQMSKHAALALAETLFHELADTSIGVSALCPGFVPTRILDAERNRPESLRASDAPAARPMSGGWNGVTPALQASAVSPPEIAEQVLQAVRDERFWVLTHANALQRVASRYEPILQGSNPSLAAASGDS